MQASTTTSAVPVLMYHSISRVAAGPYRDLAVPPARLAEQLSMLAGAGYRLTGLTEAVDLVTAGSTERLVALTFDDGYVDFLETALPVLTSLDVGATLYPVAGGLGQPADWLGGWAGGFGPLLSWSQLAEVAEAGVEIGNHGLRHHPLDLLPAPQLHQEIRTSRDLLEQRVRRPVRSFCYPHGYHNRAVRAAVALAGHDNACEVGRRRYRPVDDRLAIPRLQPTAEHTGEALLRLATTGGPQLGPQARRLAKPAWRVARRLSLRMGRPLT